MKTSAQLIFVSASVSLSLPSARWRLLREWQRQRAAGSDLPGGASRGWERPRWWGIVRGGSRERGERSPGLQHHFIFILLGGSAAGESERQTAASGELATKLLPCRPQQEVPHKNRVHQQGNSRNMMCTDHDKLPCVCVIHNNGFFCVFLCLVPSVQLRKLWLCENWAEHERRGPDLCSSTDNWRRWRRSWWPWWQRQD